MAQNKPAGPGVISATAFLAGLGLILWSVYFPSIHIIWAVPLGLLLAVSSVGKMFVR